MTTKDGPELGSLRSICTVSDGLPGNRFVGISGSNEGLSVTFPLGYRFPLSAEELRSDIRALLSAIRRFGPDSKDLGSLTQRGDSYTERTPVADYFVLIDDFLRTGRLFSEEFIQSAVGHSGAIDWRKTILSVKPLVSNQGRFIYPSFSVRRRNNQLDSALEQIHEYCLHRALAAIGWLYPNLLLHPARLQSVSSLHERLVVTALSQTFNDRDRLLLVSMLNIIRHSGSFNIERSWKLGTDRFEYVWEGMIDAAFGIPSRQEFFPGARWSLFDDKYVETAKLQPDTVMDIGRDRGIIILDAKYYRYCSTSNPRDLPGTESIAKQIVYGDYASNIIPKMRGWTGSTIFNAFVLPGDLVEMTSSDRFFYRLGAAYSDWSDHEKPWHTIHAVIADTRFMLRSFSNVPAAARRQLISSISEH